MFLKTGTTLETLLREEGNTPIASDWLIRKRDLCRKVTIQEFKKFDWYTVKAS